jgi:tRNA pseudouridine13 synthase
MAAVYTSLLAKHGLPADCFRHHVKELSMPGAYRRIVQRPADLTWQFFSYSDPTSPLVQTDLSVLRKEPPPQGDGKGSMRAVVLSFMLPSSTYATMLLRELTKQSTSLSHQKELNVYQAPQAAAP